jgi:fatty acid desaturase
VHPSGDGYHTLHHVFPTVSAFWLERFHRELKQDLNVAYHAGVLNRQMILQEPNVGLEHAHDSNDRDDGATVAWS